MVRFEALQMAIAESAKNFLDIYNMQTFIEQFTLDRESRIYLTLPEKEPPFLVSATVSFIYDALQTGMTVYENEDSHNENSITLDFVIRLPVMEDYPDIEELLEEISEEFPETEPVLSTRETFPSLMHSREYEIFYSYDIEVENVINTILLDEIFSELRGVMDLIYERTKNYIDSSWYRGEDDSFKRD